MNISKVLRGNRCHLELSPQFTYDLVGSRVSTFRRLMEAGRGHKLRIARVK